MNLPVNRFYIFIFLIRRVYYPTIRVFSHIELGVELIHHISEEFEKP